MCVHICCANYVVYHALLVVCLWRNVWDHLRKLYPAPVDRKQHRLMMMICASAVPH
jgi:hypothetical protein